MPLPSLPSSTHAVNDPNHPADHNLIVEALVSALYSTNNLSDLGSATTARANLGFSYPNASGTPAIVPRNTTFHVTDYGAAGNGTTNDATAVQAAVTAAAAVNGTVYLPPGTFLLNSPLTLSTNITVQGAGRDVSTLLLGSGVNDYAIKFNQGGSNVITGARFADFQINGAAASQTAGGGISAVGSTECQYERLHFTDCYNWGLYLQGTATGGVFGRANRVERCLFDGAVAYGAGGGICTTSNIENMVVGCDFQNLGGATYGTGGGPYPAMILDLSGFNMITGCLLRGSRASSTNVVGVQIQYANNTRIVGCVFDGVGGDGVFVIGTDNAIVANTFLNIGSGGTAVGSGVQLQNTAVRNTVTANNFVSSSTNGQTRSMVRETQMGSMGSNVIANNTFYLAGTTADGTIEAGGIASVYRANINYNPVGHLTSPSVPATTVALVNPFNVDCSVFVSGGTVTAIAIGGTSTGQTSGQFLIPAAQSITLTYSAAPTWTWFGN